MNDHELTAFLNNFDLLVQNGESYRSLLAVLHHPVLFNPCI